MAGHETPKSYEACEEHENWFFEETSNELKICKLEIDRDHLREMIESGDSWILELLKASPVIRDTNFLRWTEYDPLTHFDNPPVIWMLWLKYIEEEKRYHDNFVDWYWENYRDFLFTQDTDLASANWFFVDYNGSHWLITAAHVWPSFYKGLDTNRPNYELDWNTDALFFDFDDNMRSHMSSDLLSSIPNIHSPIAFPESEVDIQWEIVSVISYDKWWNFADEHWDMKLEVWVAIFITQEIEDEMINLWLSDYSERRDNVIENEVWEVRESRLERIDQIIEKIKNERGTYVWKYLYRISPEQNSTGGGMSWSPAFIWSEFVWILISGPVIRWNHFSVISPVSMIEETVLSKLD